MSKSRAALTHLKPTLLLIAGLAALVFLAWYPYPFWQFGKSGKFALMLILTAACIGPALTWVVYKKGKWGLVFDLWVIALVQLAAIGWGTLSLYQNRPFFMVYTLDRFEVLSKRDIDLAWITDPEFLNKPFVGPLMLFANMPQDPVDYQKLLKEIMFEGKPDLQFRPEFWSLYSERKQYVLEKSRPLADLRDGRPDSIRAIDELVKTHGGDINQLKFVPALQSDGQFAVIIDTLSGEVVDSLIIDPWLKS